MILRQDTRLLWESKAMYNYSNYGPWMQDSSSLRYTFFRLIVVVSYASAV